MKSAALQVELIGEGVRWSEILGPAAVVVAAIVGAVFASRYASRNVAKELRAADARQRRELRHDQRMRAREATRATIDDVTSALTKAMDSFAFYTAQVITMEEISQSLAEADDESQEKADLESAWEERLEILTEKMMTSHTANAQLSPARLRLRLRFPEQDPVFITYSKACVAIRECFAFERGYGPRVRSKKELEAAEKLRKTVAPRVDEFINAVRSWLDTTLEPEDY